MSDIVERARARNMPYGHLELIDKLAAEIERLEKEIDFWKYSADKYWQQAMQYRERLDHYERRL